MRILCDVHNHTLYSRHAYSTIEENVRAAAEVGLELLGSADHFSGMLWPKVDGQPDLRDYQYFINYKAWPETWHGVRLLHGVEADIVDLEGHLFGWDTTLEAVHEWGSYGPRNLQELALEQCDFAVASIHDPHFSDGASFVQTTDMYVSALDHPQVLILGHVGRAGVPFDVDTVLLAAKERHKLIEINEASFAYPDVCPLCRDIAIRCAELGVSISVASDAHISTQIGRFPHVEALLDEIGFPEELVACRSAEAFLDALHRAIPSHRLDN